MPSVIQERIQKLMAEQAAEAELPTSRAVMESDEPADAEPQPETEEAEPMEPPLPAEAATEFPEQSDVTDQENDTEQDSELPDAESGESQEPQASAWDEAIDDMEQRFTGDQTEEEYQPQEPTFEDELSWQQSLSNRSNSI